MNGSRRRQRTLYFLRRNFMSSCEMKLDAILYVLIFTSQDKWCGGWVTLLISGASLGIGEPWPTSVMMKSSLVVKDSSFLLRRQLTLKGPGLSRAWRLLAWECPAYHGSRVFLLKSSTLALTWFRMLCHASFAPFAWRTYEWIR